MNIIKMGKLTKMEKDYLFGIFIGDGYKNYDKKQRHYTIEFYLHSERDLDIQKYLIYILQKIGLCVFVMKDKRFKCSRIKTHSKQLFRLLDEFNVTNADLGLGFIAGLVDAEGHVDHQKSFINVVNTDKSLLGVAAFILKDINIETKIRQRVKSRKDRKNSYILSIPYKIKDIRTNSIKINSGKTSKHSGNCLSK